MQQASRGNPEGESNPSTRLAADRHRRWIDMGQRETSVFDLITMLIPLQAAGLA